MRINTKPNLEYSFNFSRDSILSRINQDRYCFSFKCEMRITFSSSIRDMTYDYYLNQLKSMCEIKLNEILAKNPQYINCLNEYSSLASIRKYSHIL